jgi:hypothetical protein
MVDGSTHTSSPHADHRRTLDDLGTLIAALAIGLDKPVMDSPVDPGSWRPLPQSDR